MTVGLSHFHIAQHELRPLEPPRLCGCGRRATERDGRCASCWEQRHDIVADAEPWSAEHATAEEAAAAGDTTAQHAIAMSEMPEPC